MTLVPTLRGFVVLLTSGLQLKARLILRRELNLTRQRHDRDQTENQPRQPWTAVSSYLFFFLS